MIKTYIPRGVCSRRYDIAISDDGVIEDIRILGGCNGNLQGIAALIRGQKAEDVIEKFEGISCGGRPTSCPDQIAKALKEALREVKV